LRRKKSVHIGEALLYSRERQWLPLSEQFSIGIVQRDHQIAMVLREYFVPIEALARLASTMT
jgi:hypothetical protein